MNYREATIAGIPQILIVRHLVEENTLRNPSHSDVKDYITHRGKGWVCKIENTTVGFVLHTCNS